MKILILGFSKSGKSVFELLKESNDCYIYDEKKIEIKNYYSFSKLKKELPFFDLIIRSPGVKITSKVYQLCLQLTNRMISEIEFGLSYLKDNFVIGVTGSNGKTTLVKMIYTLLKDTYNVHLLGNIGIPLTSKVKNINKKDIVILELSSFQLENIYSKQFDIGVITNISNNHCDSVFLKESYIASKLKLINLSKLIYLNNDSLKYINCSNNIVQIETLDININNKLNKYNQVYWNIATDIARKLNVDDKKINNCKLDFEMDHYRMEKVYKYNNLVFINDSKATSVSATNACLDVYNDKRRIIILGGISKKENFKYINKNENDIVLTYGKDKIKIFSQVGDAYFISLYEVMLYIRKKYISLNAYVILSPACASFDQFSSYEDRGKKFNQLVEDIFINLK